MTPEALADVVTLDELRLLASMSVGLLMNLEQHNALDMRRGCEMALAVAACMVNRHGEDAFNACFAGPNVERSFCAMRNGDVMTDGSMPGKDDVRGLACLVLSFVQLVVDQVGSGTYDGQIVRVHEHEMKHCYSVLVLRFGAEAMRAFFSFDATAALYNDLVPPELRP